MGDQVGAAVSGTLYYVPLKEFERARALPGSAVERTALFAALARINVLYMIARAGSGHIGSSFSSMEIMSWIQLNELRGGKGGEEMGPSDLFFSSKGHDAPGLYSVLIGMGLLDYDLLHRLRRLNGLPGHPDVGTPQMVTNTGSLGMGVSKAKGMIFANRLLGHEERVFVLTGDGELQEGQFWESLISAANHKLNELTIIIDHNKLQSDTLVSKVSDLGNLEGKFAAFGWHVERCDGHELKDLSRALANAKAQREYPTAIIADTIKGKGVSFMEHTSIDSDVELYKFHSGAPSADAYRAATQELIDRANAALAEAGADALELEAVERPVIAAPADEQQRLVAAYSDALIEQARANERIVALDADLVLDTGLIPFQQQIPERFVECGIAEQDMVSQAGGMALKGLLPVVHSFACFLSSRPNEQIYNNATEHTKIVYVASLAGVLPGGPGHSHQAVRDISSLAGVPGLTMMEPSCAQEVGLLLDWALNANPGSSYIRLVSIPCDIRYTLPQGYVPRRGEGVTLAKGRDVALIAYGPVMLPVAMEAAQMLAGEGVAVKVINLPWLNAVDRHWLAREVSGARAVVSLDNHFIVGGQGDRIADALATIPHAPLLRRVGLSAIPPSGQNAEVLEAVRMNADSVAAAVRAALSQATQVHVARC